MGESSCDGLRRICKRKATKIRHLMESLTTLRQEYQELSILREAEHVCVNMIATMSTRRLRRSDPNVVELVDLPSSPRVASPFAKMQKFATELLGSPPTSQL